MWDVGLPDGLALTHGRMTSGELVLTIPRTLRSQLAVLGLTASDIEYISLSHTHVDHVRLLFAAGLPRRSPLTAHVA
jgi:N-acyl homoserine lactone hydrolase